jgi:lipopolysaccharide transport system ATP-binding protein
MSDIVIRAESLSKRYRIGERERYVALRDILARAVSAPTRLFRARKPSLPNGDATHIWALKDVSFEVRQGEVVGMIGRNGAGKTTLLKILARVTRPTEGCARVRGRVGSLLEVGTGFHPELTGRENVYLSGAILGMTKAEIQRNFDDIIAFSEVEKFIDTPLKHYSSGMQMRLAFAVAAHLEPEILLVDEVLAVGDLEFQRKCLGKMGDVARTGRTVLFVSHNMGAVARLCPRTIWLEAGRIVRDAPSSGVLAEYQSKHLKRSANWTRPPHASLEGEVSFLEVTVVSMDGTPCVSFAGNEQATIKVRYKVAQPLRALQIGARICAHDGTVVLSTADVDGTGYSGLPKDPGVYTGVFRLTKGLLAPGSYSVFLAANVPGRQAYEVIDQTVSFEISNVDSLASIDGRLGAVTPLFEWETTKEASDDDRTSTPLASPSLG